MNLLLTDIKTICEKIVWVCLRDALGTVMMEDLAPGSAPLYQVVGSSIVLMRAVQKPHRRALVNDMLRIIHRRRDEVEDAWNPVSVRAVKNLGEYEALAAMTWAVMITNTTSHASDYMPDLILRGWELASGVGDSDTLVARFCFHLLAAADAPMILKQRDYWAFRAFEPIASVGSKVATHLGLNLED